MQRVVDWERAVNRAGGDTELASELFGMLQAELPERIELLRKVRDDGDYQRLQDPIHKLAGSCRYCGTMELEAVVEELSLRLKDGRAPDGELLTRAIHAAEAVLAAGD